jgi:BirA family transcriptional regulator, biotin operon repressor / biotin---[acetyl-CoA-carboxylase] ligase
LSNFNANFIGKVRHTFRELESTQTFAQEWLTRSRPGEGALVAAAYQTSGKGLLKNRWESEPGQNLLFSFILYPNFLPLKRSFLLSQALALGLREWVGERLDLPAQVKWPNDVYVGDKKVAGMLIQNALSGHLIQSSIVGIGVNVNQQAFPPELPNPASLYTLSGQRFDLDASLDGICASLENWYLRLKRGDWAFIEAEYMKFLFGYGEWRAFARADGVRFEGRIVEVAENGYLRIETEGGVLAFEVKEVQFLFI